MQLHFQRTGWCVSIKRVIDGKQSPPFAFIAAGHISFLDRVTIAEAREVLDGYERWLKEKTTDHASH